MRVQVRRTGWWFVVMAAAMAARFAPRAWRRRASAVLFDFAFRRPCLLVRLGDGPWVHVVPRRGPA